MNKNRDYPFVFLSAFDHRFTECPKCLSSFGDSKQNQSLISRLSVLASMTSFYAISSACRICKNVISDENRHNDRLAAIVPLSRGCEPCIRSLF